MTTLLKDPGPHKVNIAFYKNELFELIKKAMVKSPKLYQFSSIKEFENDFTIKYPCEIYIWNSEDCKLVGFLGHYMLSKNTDELLIIVVHPSFQNRGYGKKMMEFYFNLLEWKTKSILSTHEKNYSAIKFYQSLGYKFIKKL